MSKIILGPFRSAEVQAIEGVLTDRGVSYRSFLDEQAREQLPKPWPMGRDYHVAEEIFLIEMQELDFDQVSTELDRFGISKPTNGDFELSEKESEPRE